MRVLSIGQLPKEIGGNYTTGIAKVVFELSKQSFNDVKMYLYATNISDKFANKHYNIYIKKREEKTMFDDDYIVTKKFKVRPRSVAWFAIRAMQAVCGASCLYLLYILLAAVCGG